MENQTADLLRRLEREPIRSISLQKDEVTFKVDGGSLNCVRLPSIRSGDAELPIGSGAWLLALWNAIGQTPTRVRLEPGRLAFRIGEHDFAVDLEAPDHPSPESAILSFDKDGWAVF